ncbi:MAG: SpoIIE family protein phosphatase, partial [Candidatus Dormibacteraeota bacterium]|nr:SpoIIE family protein phosphatase [Candidatus Dormibacteraeota bacterium]
MVRQWRYAAMEDPSLAAWWARAWPRLVAVALVTAAYIVWVRFQVGGDHVTRGVDDLGNVAAAAVAVTVSARRALRSSGAQARYGWGLVAAFSAALGLGDAIYAYFDFFLRVPVPFPSAADVSYLIGSFLGVAAVLVLTGRGWMSSRVRSLLDGGIISAILLLLAWEFVLFDIYQRSSVSHPGFWIAVSYPVAEIFMAAIVLSAVTHTRGLGADIYLLMAGLVVLALSDAGYSYLVGRGLYHGASVIDGGYVASYLLIAVAAAEAGPPLATRRRALARWQLVLPYIPFTVAAVAATVALVGDEPADRFGEVLVAVVLGLVMARQLAAVVEAHALAGRLDDTVGALVEAIDGWRDAAKEREILIEQAPVGISRLDRGGQILTANRTLQQMLGYAREELVGQPFWALLHQQEAELGPEYRDLGEGRIDRLYAEARFFRKDGTVLWCSAIAVPLRDEDGRPEGFIAILRDITDRRREAEHAAEIQRQLLPRSAPRIHGYELAADLRPAKQVAGDLYDWVTTNGDVDLTLADVMGKGVGPGLVMAALRTALHSAAPDLGPADRIRLAAESLTMDTEQGTGLFITLFQARLDPSSGRLRFVDAGHGYWGIRRHGGQLVKLGPRSLPLGIELDGGFAEGQVQLDPGDTLIVYSDGLVETAEGTVELGELVSGLADDEPAEATVERLMERVPAPADDVTVMVLRRLPSVGDVPAPGEEDRPAEEEGQISDGDGHHVGPAHIDQRRGQEDGNLAPRGQRLGQQVEVGREQIGAELHETVGVGHRDHDADEQDQQVL